MIKSKSFCETVYETVAETKLQYFFDIWCQKDSALVVFDKVWARLKTEEEQLFLLRKLRSIMRKRLRGALISPVLKPGTLEKDGRDWTAINEVEQGLVASYFPKIFLKARTAINFTIRKKPKSIRSMPSSSMNIGNSSM